MVEQTALKTCFNFSTIQSLTYLVILILHDIVWQLHDASVWAMKLNRNILEVNQLETVKHLRHDKDPKYTAKATMQLLRSRHIHVFVWHCQSSELNPIAIANLWRKNYYLK